MAADLSLRDERQEPVYTRDILRLAASIPGQRSFDEIDGPILRSPTCGSRVAMVVTIDDDGQVASIAQAVEACAFGQASAALLGKSVTGLTRPDAEAALASVYAWLGGAAGEPWPGMATLEPARARRGRHGAILLPFRALVDAIDAAS